MSEPDSKPDQIRLVAWAHGRVQGVGFRWWTRSRALELGLTGYAANRPDGRVLVVAQGSRDACERLLQLLQNGKTPGHIDKIVADWSPRGEVISGFTER
jgi:acylphosphatase